MIHRNVDIEALEEENKFLRDERRKSVEALEMASNLGRFDVGSNSSINVDFILNETSQKLKTLIRFKSICFYLVDEKDHSFYPAMCDNIHYKSFIEDEISRFIDDHTFAWVLRRGREVVLKTSDNSQMLLLRPMTTPSRVRGMFVGVLDQDKEEISDTDYALISIVIMSSASALESIETYDYMRCLNKQLEEQAQETERMYRDIFENAPIAIFRTTPEGKFLKVNPKYAEIIGFDSAEQMVEKVRDIADELYLNPEDRDNYKSILNSKGNVLNYEVQLKTRQGKPFWASMSSRAVKNSEGRIIYYDGFMVNITERKEAQIALFKAKEEAEAASKIKSEFLANMSHELRTPLNGMLGMLQLLEHSGLDSEQQEFVDLAIKAGQRLTDLLSNILDLCKIEKGMVVIDEKPLMISSVFEHIADTFSVACQEKGIACNIYVDENIPASLTGDVVRLKGILFNLAGNAVKFTEEGEVRLEAHLIRQETSGTVHVLFIVKDTGVGISDDVQSQIFEPFIQAEGSYTRKFQGAGLGLSVVRRMVHLMNGKLSVESQEGAGSSFYFSVPLKSADALTQDSDEQSQCIVKDQRKVAKRILIVEDESTNQFFAQKMLEKLGYKTATADDGTTALEILEKEHFDCILMDIQLKQMDGVEATRIIRNHDGSKYNPQIPIIAVTSYAMKGDKEKFIAAGMNEYLPKPLRTNDLKELLKKVLA
ncbi:PAS domain-containing hybrid sensor histidine kinase/response regulator [Desulfonatronovibrio magnus]|uniref:PAS domain-containing hybrid sensor histidine kinase/response regulator n=1 Tax=Desulfonatronovibrio magnus TaxID=698827 RepID=UPI00069692AD|nr:response regulator [Desulfonatronovibrio magnus]RQD65383.1 MAG: response regulator [Desulfonatronovibrio sp. MSAO_Bac4]